MNRKALKIALVEKGISQAELARRIGITPHTLSLKVTGKTRIWLDEAEAICRVLDIRDPYSLFFENDKAECGHTLLSR